MFQDIVKPRSLYQYKSQEESKQPSVSLKSLAVCIKYTLVFQTVTSFIGNLLIWRFRYQWINIVNPLPDVPSFSRYVIIIKGEMLSKIYYFSFIHPERNILFFIIFHNTAYFINLASVSLNFKLGLSIFQPY